MGTSSNKTKPYLSYILAKWKRLIWDPNKYLNIWLAKFTTFTSTTGTSTSYQMWPPRVMHPDYDLASIPGLDWEHKESFNLDDVEIERPNVSVLRKDIQKKCEIKQEELYQNVKVMRDTAIEVPKIIE